MEAVGALLVIVALAVAVAVVGLPLLPGREERTVARDELRRADLEAAKVAKYREIRDAELDRDTGKLSDEDWRQVDRRLRAEAVSILDELDELPEPGAAPAGDGPGGGGPHPADGPDDGRGTPATL